MGLVVVLLCLPIFSTDIDECASNNGGCAQVCTNNEGSFTCSCSAGFELSSGRFCNDIDECARQEDNCQQTCTNTDGSFTCSCQGGFSLNNNGRSCDGVLTVFAFTEQHVLFVACLDINECASQRGGCDQICTNNAGSFSCACNSGYQLQPDGRTCLGEFNQPATHPSGDPLHTYIPSSSCTPEAAVTSHLHRAWNLC